MLRVGSRRELQTATERVVSYQRHSRQLIARMVDRDQTVRFTSCYGGRSLFQLLRRRARDADELLLHFGEEFRHHGLWQPADLHRADLDLGQLIGRIGRVFGRIRRTWCPRDVRRGWIPWWR